MANTGNFGRFCRVVAKKDGRTQPRYRPARLDTLEVDGKLVVSTGSKAEALARHLAKKL